MSFDDHQHEHNSVAEKHCQIASNENRPTPIYAMHDLRQLKKGNRV